MVCPNTKPLTPIKVRTNYLFILVPKFINEWNKKKKTPKKKFNGKSNIFPPITLSRQTNSKNQLLNPIQIKYTERIPKMVELQVYVEQKRPMIKK